MIAGGGLGDVAPGEVGPISMQAPNGVVDVVVADEAEAATVARRLLACFRGAGTPGVAPDQARMRTLVPERERRAYEVAPVIETLADEGTVTFLREAVAPELVTALVRIEGRPVGVMANNTFAMAGAVTAAAQENAGALNAAQLFEIDDVIDPAQTPDLIVATLAAADGSQRPPRRNRFVDTW